MGPRLFVRCLGEPVILDRHRQPITLRTDKHLALVLFLVVEPRHRATRERLRRMLWPNGKAAQSLSQAISEIRRALGEDVFEVTTNHIALHRNVEIETDLALLRTGSAELMIRELSQSFWGHVLFDGMEIEDAEEWNSWLQLERHRWRELLGRIATQAAAASGVWGSESSQLRLATWGAALRGTEQTALESRRSARLRWPSVDPRVVDASRLLSDAYWEQVFSIEVGGSDVDDALAVTVAAILSVDSAVSVHEANRPEFGSTIESLAQLLLSLPGSAGASPESVNALRSVTVMQTQSPSVLKEAADDVITAVLEATSVLVIVDAETATQLRHFVQGRRSTAEGRRLWIVSPVDAQGESLPYCTQQGIRLTIPAMDHEMALEAASLLSLCDTHDTHRLATIIEISMGSCVLLDCLMSIGAQHSVSGVTSTPLSDYEHLAKLRIRSAIDLPSQLCTRLAKRAQAMLSGVKSSSGSGASRKISVPTMAPRSLVEQLLLSESDEALDWLEDQTIKGRLQGPVANASLLLVRTYLGLAHFGVVEDAIIARCEEADTSSSALYPEEVLAFALLSSSDSLRDSLTRHARQVLWDCALKGLRENCIPRTIAATILAQQDRNSLAEAAAIRTLVSLCPNMRGDNHTVEYVMEYALANRAMRLGNYQDAHRRSGRLLQISRERGYKGAYQSAISLRATSAFRLGSYREVAALAQLYSPARLRSKVLSFAQHPLFIARALLALGPDQRDRRFFSQMEDTFAYPNGPRASIMGAEYLAATGRRKRALQLAELAFSASPATLLEGQQGLSAKWAGLVLPSDDFEETISKAAEMRSSIDARDQVILVRSARSRGICTRQLESAGFHQHRLPEPALT